MDQQELLAERFEEHRPRLRAVAYRMLGSVSEADDAVQESWLRLSQSDACTIENLGAWLTTVVGRVSLNMLRGRRSRREDSLTTYLPDFILDSADGADPEHEALLADSVGMALMIVLETLTPAERLAFVLHDSFSVPYDEIASIVDRSPEATRQLASRARRRVRAANREEKLDQSAQKEVVDAFLTAARHGDLDALVSILDPEVVLRVDGGAVPGVSRIVDGAETVAGLSVAYRQLDLIVKPVLVNGALGAVSMRQSAPFSITSFTVRNSKVVEMNILADPARLGSLDLSFLEQ